MAYDELQERVLDARIADLEQAIKTTIRLLNEPRWAADLVLTEALRKYKYELMNLKIQLKQIVLQKHGG